MHFQRTTSYQDIEILPQQEKYLSSIEKIKNALLQHQNYGFYIYVNQQKIGFILLRQFAENQFFLWNYIIDKNFQNQGYGTNALIELLVFLKENFAATLLTTTYTWGNQHAKSLYEKVGFSETEVIQTDDIHEVNLKIIL